MEWKRRFIFHGHAVAIGGRIIRPDDVILDPKCASALAVTGGRTRSNLKATRFGKYVRLSSAATLAEGLFDKPKQVEAARKSKPGGEEALTSKTTVRVEVQGLAVGADSLLKIQRLRGSLIARSPAAADAETAITLGNDTSIEGVTVGEFPLIVELNKRLFQEYDTYSKLRQSLSLLTDFRGTCHGTLVKSIRWRGKPYPDATIDEHVVYIPNFGRIYFGEILITKDARRVTMIRMELGSPAGGDCAAGDMQDNGGWSP